MVTATMFGARQRDAIDLFTTDWSDITKPHGAITPSSSGAAVRKETTRVVVSSVLSVFAVTVASTVDR